MSGHEPIATYEHESSVQELARRVADLEEYVDALVAALTAQGIPTVEVTADV